LGWYSRVTKVGTKRLIHGLVKQTQFCVSFIALWWRNWSFQTPQSCQFSNRSLLRSSPVVMNLRWRLAEYCQKNNLQRRDICEEFSVWHIVTKSTGLKSVKPGMPSHFSESRDPTYVSSAIYPECPRKDWRTKPFRRLQSTSGAHSLSKDQVAWLHLWPCLVPSWCGASRTIWDHCWLWGISGPPWAAAPTTPPKRKAGTKMSKWMSV